MVNNKVRFNKPITCLLIATVICCLAPLFYLTIARDMDERVCIPETARRISVKQDRAEIYDWIYAHEKLGFTREEFQSVLEEVGPVTFVDSRLLSDGTTEDRIGLNICRHPMNNFILIGSFSKTNELIGFSIDMD